VAHSEHRNDMTASPTDESKRLLRAEALARRRAAHLSGAAAASESVLRLFIGEMAPAPDAVVAGYWPMGDELDVRPLLERLAADGRAVALPVVAAKGQPLEFRRWRPGDLLEAGAHGTRHPLAAAAAVEPDLVLVPLLAFDDGGWRLGYGGGYYDRTLALLRARKPVVAVGVGYAAQRVAAVPRDGRDQRLDWMMTERGLSAPA